MVHSKKLKRLKCKCYVNVALNEVLLSLEANCELNYTTFGVLGYLPHFKKTVQRSTLTHWFDLSAKAKVLNSKIYIQWDIMQS